MNVYKKLMMDREGLTENGPINIVIFGDSVSHGAFNDYFDFEAVYWNRLRQRLNAYRCYIPVNMICTAIGGTTAKKSLPRLESQVLVHRPDLVIVSFGLNDVNGELDVYLDALREIFESVMKRREDKIDPIRSQFGKIEKDEVDMDAKMSFVQDFILLQRKCSFRNLLEKQHSKMEVIVTFMVVLELMKIGKILIEQQEAFGDIYITSKEAA